MLAKYYGKSISRERASELANLGLGGVSIRNLVEAAEHLHMRTHPVNVDYETLAEQAPLPCIVYWQHRHFLIVYKITAKKVYVVDPAIGHLVYRKQDFLAGWVDHPEDPNSVGVVVLVEPSPEFYEDEIETDYARERGEKGMYSSLRFLLPYLRPYRNSYVRLFLGLVVITAIQLIFPFLTQAVVDQGINYQNMDLIYLILIAQLALFLSRTITEIIRDWLLLYIGSRTSVAILSDFLGKLMKLPIKFFETRAYGDILQRIQDHRRLEQFLTEQMFMMVYAVMNLVIFGLVLAIFQFWLFALYFIGTVLYILWVVIFMKRREKIDYMRFDQMSASQSSSIQILQGMPEIKLNNSQKRRRWMWESYQVKFYKVEMKNLSLFHIQRTGGTFISEIKNIFITFVAAKSVIDGIITLGTMLSVQYIIGQLNNPIRRMVDFMMAYQNARISLDRVSDIHNRENEAEESAQQFYHLPEQIDKIQIENLSFSYSNSPLIPKVLEDVSFEIPTGKTTAIVGVSGSGKTTLLKLMLKLYPLAAGSISIGNMDLKHINASVWRQVCGVVMQDGYIFNDTILRNITESDSEVPLDRQRLMEAVRIANLEEYIESLSAGYNEVLASGGANLSGGQKQRILIARAIYKNPDFLFFDEATSSLDADNEKVIMENLEDFYTGKTVVIIAHRLSTVKNADQIIVVDRGQIIETGTHESLTALKGKYYMLVKNQLELGQ